MDVQTLVNEMIDKRAWVPLAALVIGFLVRLCKSDTKFPIDIPPKWRWTAALLLGAVSAVLEKKMNSNLTWLQASVGGVFSFALAVAGHSGIIDGMRSGKEFVVPFMTKPGVPPGPGKPTSLPPPADGGTSPGMLPPSFSGTSPPPGESDVEVEPAVEETPITKNLSVSSTKASEKKS